MLKIIERNFILTLMSFGFLGYFFHSFFALITPYAHYFIMINLFLGFLKMDFSELVRIKKYFLNTVFLALISVVLIPTTVYYFTPFLDNELKLGLFLLAAANCGATTPLFSGLLGFNVLKSGLFVLLTSMLVVFCAPFLVSFFFKSEVSFDKVSMALYLSEIVVIPSVIGVLFKEYLPENKVIKISSVSPWLGTLNLAFMIATVVAKNHGTIDQYIFSLWTLYAFIGVSIVFGFKFLVGFLVNYKRPLEGGLLFVVINNSLMVLLALQFFSPKVVWVCILSNIPWIFSFPLIKFYNDKKN